MRACNFIKKETLAQLFSCEFYEISKNTFFTEHLKETLAQLFSCEFYKISKNTFFTEHLWAVASDIPTKKHSQLEISVGKQKTKMMNELRFFWQVYAWDL